MFGNLWKNLSKNQRIGVLFVLQIVFIGLIASVIYVSFQPKENVEIVNESDNNTSMPDDYWRGVKNEIWHLIESNIDNLTVANIDDAVIREGTYNETNNNDITTATFLLDIESLRQTYAITVSWSDAVELYDAIQINCPPRDQMLYPDTVCQGMYNNTYSLDLYLPYVSSAEEGRGADSVPLAPNYTIHGDEEAKTIEIMVSSCNAEKYKKEALDYLNSTPIKLSEYTILYEVNDVNVDCS